MLDQAPQNKMTQTPPAKKGFHFASDGIHLAEFVEALTIEEATAIYHQVKRLISPNPASPATAIESTQSTTSSTAGAETNG